MLIELSVVTCLLKYLGKLSLLKFHKNKLFATIQDHKSFDLPLSKYQIEDDGETFEISIRDTQLKFIVQQSAEEFDKFRVRYSLFKPGFPVSRWNPKKPSTFRSTEDEYDNLSYVIDELKIWLHTTVGPYLRETETPDLWLQVQNYESLAPSLYVSQQDFEHFTEEQKRTIHRSLREFRNLLVDNFEPTQEQLKIVNKQITYLGDAVDRLNRFDWKGLTLSILTGIAINLAVDTNGGRLIFSLFEQAFAPITKLLYG